MKTQLNSRSARRHLWALALLASFTGAAGCLHYQTGTGGDSETAFVTALLAIAGEFARALLAAFLF